MTIKSIIKDKRRLFWLLHLGGWAAWGLIGKYLYTRSFSDELAPSYAVYVAVITGIAIGITLLLRFLYRYVDGRALWVQGVAFVAGSCAAAYTWIESRSFIYSTWIESTKDMEAYWEKVGAAAEVYEQLQFSNMFSAAWTVMAGWSVLYFAIKHYRTYREMRESALKSAAMAHEAQLKMLRYQLNPHFLFNTLNAISTLVLEKQTELANKMVSKMSSFLRYSLDNDPMLKIPLAQELTALQLYLDIEKVRFEERLQLELDIQDKAKDALIPSLLLQPLVENAIKYGIACSEEGGHLRISAKVFAGELLLELSDDGPGVALVNGDIAQSNGVGLRNTRERLKELYGDKHAFRLQDTDPHGLTVNIRVPFETSQ